MNLFPHAENPGLWVNKAWQPGTPGTFALVVGISDYTALDGGMESLTLGKLPVSALSAFRFFRWLEKDYFITGCPLARCWLLLAPTKDELQLAPEMAQALSPDFDSCYKAIHAWVDEMKKLPEPAAKESRSIFFFSGHGLEEIEDRQFLLPREYEPARNVERAMSADNIARGLKRLKVPLHFLFLDACRSDYDKRSEYAPLTGTKILNEPTKDTINKKCKVSTFYASAAGATAWSPEVTSGVMSVFSQALIEGLKAQGLQPECDPEKCCIYLRLLDPFMETRMAEILRLQYRSLESQEPRVRGDQVLKEVTELSSPQPQDWLPPSPPEPTPDLGGPSLPISGDAIGLTLRGNTAGKISDDEMGAFLDAARVYNLSSKEWLPNGSVEITNLHREDDTNSYEFDLQLRKAVKGSLYWLQISNKVQTLACALPVDLVEQTTFHASARAISQSENLASPPVALLRLNVTLSEKSSGLLREATRLWPKSERGFLTNSDFDTTFLKKPSPELSSGIESSKISLLGAMINAAILSRAARWSSFGDWVQALTPANPDMTDGAVLWTERCLWQEQGSAIEALRYFMLMDSSTLPILSHTVSLALRQAEYFSSLKALPDAFKQAIARIHRRLSGAVGTFRPGGLFACFMGRIGQLSPEIIAAPAVTDELRRALSRAVLRKHGRVKKPVPKSQPEHEIVVEADTVSEILQRQRQEAATLAAETDEAEFTAGS